MKDYYRLSAEQYKLFQDIVLKEIGIHLNDTKLSLVESRLLKRMHHYNINLYSDYINILNSDKQEMNKMLNMITTNETYFFRENEHFIFLEELLSKRLNSEKFRFWSAASSTGAEAYSAAFVCDSTLPKNSWEVVGTDVNSDVIKKARMGLYPYSWVDKVPEKFKKRYCLKGKGRFEDQFLVDRSLSSNMKFATNNLMIPNPSLGQFDIIFLRNVLIYFEDDVKKKVIENILVNLKVGGHLIISLTENIHTLKISSLEKLQTSIFKKI